MVKGKMNTKISSKNTIWNPWISQLNANRSSKKSWLIISAGNEIELLDVAGQNVKFIFIFYVGWFYKGVCYYWESRVKWRVQFDAKYSSLPIIVTHSFRNRFETM